MQAHNAQCNFRKWRPSCGWIGRAAWAAGWLLAGAGTVHANPSDDAGNGSVWRCWFNAPVHVTCLTRSRSVPFLHIPLLSIPLDMDGPRELARAVMCAPRPACRVLFTVAPPAAHELVDAVDPLLSALD